jgi:hypothetical protein
MKCLDELEIERYVLGEAEMPEGQKVHLLRCDLCRGRFLALNAVYEPLN